MKKLLLTAASALLTITVLQAQTVIFNNGPLFDIAGGGAGGNNASTLHDGFTTYGVGHAVSSGYRVADDIIVPTGSSWNIDTLVFYSYQTGSGPNSTINNVNVRIWSGTPGAGGSIIWGDSLTNLLITTEFSGTYRTGDFTSTTCAPATCVDRPIMRNATYIGHTLTSGTYWIDWQTGGTIASGPWAPPVNLGAGNTTTGNALQYNNDPASPAYTTWIALNDGGTLTPQGLPFLVVGNVLTGLTEVQNNGITVKVSPNPISTKATISVDGFTDAGQFTFVVYDILGNEVKRMGNIATASFIFDRSGLSDGVYLFELRSQNQVLKNGKLILQ